MHLEFYFKAWSTKKLMIFFLNWQIYMIHICKVSRPSWSKSSSPINSVILFGNQLLKLHLKCIKGKLIFLLLSFTIITQLMKSDFCSHRILCNAHFMMKRFHMELLAVFGDLKQKYLKTIHGPARQHLPSDWTKPGFTETNNLLS